MYPCSNPELVAAVSEAGGIGVVQPISLTFVHGYDFRQGLRKIKELTQKPIGLNLLIEQSSQSYLKKNWDWMQIALDEGVRFFISSLGNPKKFADEIHKRGGVIYHDVVNKKFAQVAVDAGVDGLICVNNEAGGHLGSENAETLFSLLKEFKLPLICAGGIASHEQYLKVLEMGYQGVQLGTRFIATTECTASDKYKDAIVKARSSDIVTSSKMSGAQVSFIKTKDVSGTPSLIDKIRISLLQGKHTKKWARPLSGLLSFWEIKRSYKENNSAELWQAGKSVQYINSIKSVQDVVKEIVGS